MSALSTKSPSLAHSPDEIRAFVEQLIWQFIEQGLYYQGPDRRREKRHSIALSVQTTPLDEKLHPVGNPFMTTTRDISNGGISLIHAERIDAPYLSVELWDLKGTPFRAALRCSVAGPSDHSLRSPASSW